MPALERTEVVRRVAILNPMVQYQSTLDRTFAALSDPTRRGILEQLGRGRATISELAEPIGMSLTGLKKHVAILEEAGLVATTKKGRVRECSLGPSRLEDAQRWIDWYRDQWNRRPDGLEAVVKSQKEGAT